MRSHIEVHWVYLAILDRFTIVTVYFNMVCQLLVGHTRDCYSKGRYVRLGISDANNTLSQTRFETCGVASQLFTDFSVRFGAIGDKLSLSVIVLSI